MEVNVKPLKLRDFDLIIGIDWFNNIKLTWIVFQKLLIPKWNIKI
jgi:hypothetical protein